MSRCKTGWRIVCIPFGGKPWACVHDKRGITVMYRTWSEAMRHVEAALVEAR